jgi:hypothetical protein
MDLQEAFDAGFEAVKTYIERSFDALETRLLEMDKTFTAAEARIKALESKTTLKVNLP